MPNTARAAAPNGHAVRAVASAAQVAAGMASLEPDSCLPAFLRVGRCISESRSIRELTIVRSVLEILICRLALHVRARLTPGEFHALLSTLSSAENGRELRLAYEACISAIGASDTDAPGSPVSTTDGRITFGVRYIRDHCADRALSLRQVAAQVNLSPWHFDRLLKRSTGYPYREHLRLARMSIAARLLDRTFLTIKEIAARAGYAKASDLDREFRQTHGTTPTAWRRRRR